VHCQHCVRLKVTLSFLEQELELLLWMCSYDHPHIIAGHGTMGLEIVEQVPDLDAVLVPVGGGGLIAGTALAIKSLRPEVLVYVSMACVSCYS